ncbi:MAG: hypothetical protein JWQ68_2377 [Cryobacterium sp.]|jgi:hypothetical protein|nr:hypothetical protein [Cryobacterium sp.]
MSTSDTPDRNTRPGERADGNDARNTAAVPVESQPSLREDVIAREKERFGGVKIGSAFFGWLAATGMAVILTALVAATGAAIGLGTTGSPDRAGAAANQNATTVGLVGAIALIVIVFIAYYCGGYVAGRMARFNGAKQGLFVWLWAVIIAIILAIIAGIAGAQFNVLGNLNSFPRIPVNEGDLTTASIITAALVALVALAGAILGGVAGMRFHRKVDRVGLGR